MDLKDLLLTPLYLALFYGLAFAARKRFTNALTRKYFIPALTVKFIGAISLGLIYQFYYGGGDTFNYYTHIKIIYQAFMDSPTIGLRLLFANGKYDPITAAYASRMQWYTSSTEYFVAQVGACFSLFCFNTYSVIALMFAMLSFSGMWAMYLTFVRIFPLAYKYLAIACFFLPSVFFWGSGIMKDSLCIGALGWVFYGFYNGVIRPKRAIFATLLGIIGLYIIIEVKIYILLSFLPPALLWIFNEYNQRIKSPVLRIAARPFFLGVGLVVAALGAANLTAGDERYDVENIAERTKINNDYLTTYTNNGSAYNIGTIDGSIGSIIKVAPQAIVVSLYRPFIFEVRNPIMLLSALESTWFIYLTFSLLYKTGFFRSLALIASEPILTFCFLFSIILAIAVGTNSGNFGTLVRYKIPLMPFYLSALYIMRFKAKSFGKGIRRSKVIQVNNPRKLSKLATTE